MESFDNNKFHFLILKYKYFELLCIKAEAPDTANNEAAVAELVKVLEEVAVYAPSKEAHSQLCLYLTAPQLRNHKHFTDWNPSSARVECWNQGLRYLFVPQWEKLLEVNVCRLALEQCLYSLSLGGGGMVTFGSYNNFNNKKGQYLFFLFDVFLTGVGGLLFNLLSVVALHWVYGVDKFCNDLRFMMSYSPSWMMKVAWAGIAPITVFALFVGSMYRWKWPLYAGSVGYPTWAYAVGGALPMIVATPVIAFMIKQLVNKISSGKWRQICQPSKDWVPGCPVARQRLVDQNRLEEETNSANNGPSTKKGMDNAAFESTAFQREPQL